MFFYSVRCEKSKWPPLKRSCKNTHKLISLSLVKIIHMTSIVTFYTGILNTGMQRNADILLMKCIKTLRNVGG